jgi:hypothetical protein
LCPEARDLIFKTASGPPISADYLAKHFKSILDLAGLPRIRLYDLRHSAATIALAAGVSPKVVSEQLGHASTAFTLDTYAHVLPHMQDEAAARIEAMLFGEWACGRSRGARNPVRLYASGAEIGCVIRWFHAFLFSLSRFPSIVERTGRDPKGSCRSNPPMQA